MDIETIVVHGSGGADPSTGAIATPIITAKNGAFRGIEEPIYIEYGRTQNPTRECLERLVAKLEGGEYATAFSSGIAAIACIFQTLNKGDHVIFGKKLYAGSIRLVDLILSKFLEVDFIDATDIKKLETSIKPNTKYIFIETPTNPLLDIIDLEAIRDISKSKGVPYIVDNTFATPYLLQPFKYDAETIIHSTSKYLGGHNDLIGGVVVTRNKELGEKLKLYAKTLGSTPSPYDVYNTIRGTKTLALRMKRHCENAEAIAKFLVGHKNISRVYYPGLPSHKGHEIAKKQMKGYGGVVSFEVDGNYKKFAKAIAEQGPPIYLAESLGGVESLLTHPATMSHAYLTAEQRKEVGIKDNLFRLSAGIENCEDIINNLKSALDKI